MITEERVKKIAEACIDEMAIFLVDVKVNSANLIVIEVDGENGVSISDCAKLNKYIDRELDREVEDFDLKVSSPGLGQPFKTQRQYQNALGKELSILLSDGRMIEGILAEIYKDGVILNSKKEENILLKFDDIKETKKAILFNNKNHG